MIKSKKIILVLLFNVILIFLLSGNAFATAGKINHDSVRVRKGPSTDTERIEIAYTGDKVEILGEEGDWYKVKYNKIEGYISKEFVDVNGETNSNTTTKQETQVEEKTQTETSTENKSDEPTETTTAEKEQEITSENESQNNTDVGVSENSNIKTFTIGEKIILKNNIEIKILPIIYSSTTYTFEENSEVTIVEVMNEWCRIELNQDSGWVRRYNLNGGITEEINVENNNSENSNTSVQSVENIETKSEETKQQENQEEKQETNQEELNPLDKKGYISVDLINVREKSNKSSEVLATLTKNKEIEIIGEVNGWYKIKLGNSTGYVLAEYVSDEKVPETTSRSATEARTKNEENTNASVEPNNPNASAEENNSNDKEVQNNLNTEEELDNSNVIGEQNGNTDQNDIRQQIVNKAKEYVGYKYVYGGTSPSTGFDCSGLTQYVYKQFGINLSRTSRDQANNGYAVEKSELQPGDLIIFNNESGVIGHVGIYIGDGQFLHAANSKKGVIITPLSNTYYTQTYVCARRVL